MPFPRFDAEENRLQVERLARAVSFLRLPACSCGYQISLANSSPILPNDANFENTDPCVRSSSKAIYLRLRRADIRRGFGLDCSFRCATSKNETLGHSRLLAPSTKKGNGAPGETRTPDPLLRSRLSTFIKTCRSERKAGENQQVVATSDQLLAPSSSPLSRLFAAICHN